MDANTLLQTKSISDMTMIELGVVTDRAKNALFEDMASSQVSVDVRKRAMGEWALEVFKDKEMDLVVRTKVKIKHRNDINYYLRNKKIPGPSDSQQRILDLMNDIDFEIICRDLILDN